MQEILTRGQLFQCLESRTTRARGVAVRDHMNRNVGGSSLSTPIPMRIIKEPVLEFGPAPPPKRQDRRC